ncbi:hypothetical protein NDU88_003828 [Pleurodeles waltl]|uniref:Reverse transcriptase n=1 Tax=Pleurodeles waltl TaxID=8319 RepID=A0AAV7UZK2_PLEWA|nr:hypothetical protein NDU88_003828 [Pleurodeles waltl]
MARTENAAHRLLTHFAKYCEEKSLTINCKKIMGMTLQPSLSLRKKLTINHAPSEVTKHFDYPGVPLSENLSWDCQVRKAAIALKQAAGAILRFKQKASGRSISIILEIYVWKAVAAALYGAEP